MQPDGIEPPEISNSVWSRSGRRDPQNKYFASYPARAIVGSQSTVQAPHHCADATICPWLWGEGLHLQL